MTKIFVVYGTAGEYSDRSEWSIVAYPTEDLAQQHVTLASEMYRTLLHESGGDYWMLDMSKNPYDRDGRTDYTGTQYYYQEVMLEDTMRADLQDLSKLQRACEDYITALKAHPHFDDSDSKQFIFETAMEVFFGKDIWTQINNLTEGTVADKG